MKQVQGGKTIYSVYSQAGALVYRDNVTDGETTAYLGQGIRLVNSIPDYTHTDHLGSPVAMTDTTGAVLWREMYSPFGTRMVDPAANKDNQGYTGHIDDAASGLTYMQARYYDPNIGRFLSNDPVGFAEGGPRYFGRYTYVHNDPVNLTDPTGKFACCRENTDPEKDDATKLSQAGREAGEATDDFIDNYEDMREANTIGADKYFHCKANCQASARSELGERTAEDISNAREAVDQTVKGDPPEASEADQRANRAGREAGREARQSRPSEEQAEKICRRACDSHRPEALDEDY